MEPASLRQPDWRYCYCVSIVMIAVSTASTVSTFVIVITPLMPAIVPTRVTVILGSAIVDRGRPHVNGWLAVVNRCRLHVHGARLHIHGLRLHVDGLRIHRIGIGRTETNARHADTY